jgi:hypothetical protein
MKTPFLHELLRLRQRLNKAGRPRAASRRDAAAGILLAALSLSGATCAADKEQVVGEGGRILRYSSTQVRVELDTAETASYQNARDFYWRGVSVAQALRAGGQALAAMGYGRLEEDADFSLLRAERHEKLVSTSREVLRGLLKMKMGLPGKPDHQSIEALVTLRPAAGGQGVWLRARFQRTIWDSNGDSRTKQVSEPELYRDFFARLSG